MDPKNPIPTSGIQGGFSFAKPVSQDIIFQSQGKAPALVLTPEGFKYGTGPIIKDAGAAYIAFMAVLSGQAPKAVVAMKANADRYLFLRDDSQDVAHIGSFAPYVVQGQTMHVLEARQLDKEVDAAIAAFAKTRGS